MSYRARLLAEITVVLALATFLVAAVLALPNPATFPDNWKPCTVAHLRATWGPITYQDHYWVTADGRRVGRVEDHPYCTPDNTP